MTTATASTQAIVLSPSYKLPIALLVLTVPLLLVQVWAGAVVAVLGLFLLVQAATLRLQFTETDMELARGSTLVRQFPYQDWQNWRIFWSLVPVLFYFKEVNSIHFLPILFDPKALQDCLEARCPRTP